MFKTIIFAHNFHDNHDVITLILFVYFCKFLKKENNWKNIILFIFKIVRIN